MLTIAASNQFKKDYKKCIKRHLPAEIIDFVITEISLEKSLPDKYKVHKLAGEYKNCWECHLLPDWLLIWQIEERTKTLNLIRTGSHSDLFK